MWFIPKWCQKNFCNVPWDVISTAMPLLGWAALNWREGRSRNPKYGTKISAKKAWECLLTCIALPVTFAPRWRSSGNVFMLFVFVLGIAGGTYATMLEPCL